MKIDFKAFLCAGVVSLVACGGKHGKPADPTSGSGGSGAEAAAPALNGCTTYTDMTAGQVTIKWDESLASSEQRCIKIKAEQTVGFSGNFTTHPMKAAGGDSPSPFDDVENARSNPGTPEEGAGFLFSKPGTYGYICGVHAAMTGAVLVVP